MGTCYKKCFQQILPFQNYLNKNASTCSYAVPIQYIAYLHCQPVNLLIFSTYSQFMIQMKKDWDLVIIAHQKSNIFSLEGWKFPFTLIHIVFPILDFGIKLSILNECKSSIWNSCKSLSFTHIKVLILFFFEGEDLCYGHVNLVADAEMKTSGKQTQGGKSTLDKILCLSFTNALHKATHHMTIIQILQTWKECNSSPASCSSNLF